jgi:polar amino acid transport system substrate-binding protein
LTSCSQDVEIKQSGIVESKVDSIAKLVPQSISEKGEIEVGMNAPFAPAEFFADDDETQVGYEVDVLRAAAEVLGLKLNIHQASFDTIIPSIGSKFDVGASGFSVSEDRLKQMDFVSFFKAGEAFAVRDGNPKKLPDPTISDNGEKYEDLLVLCGQVVGVQTATTEDEELDDYQSSCEKAGKKDIDILRWENQAQVTTALVSGKVDYMFVDSDVLGYSMDITNGELEQIGATVGNCYHGFAVNKDNHELSEALVAAMNYIIGNGDYDKILEFWGVQSGAIEKSKQLTGEDVQSLM